MPCVTVNVCPPIVMVPVRPVDGSPPDAPVFGATENVTVPVPVPDAPPVTVIHEAFDTAVHVQVAPVVTLTLPVPPLFGNAWLVGVRAYVHGAGGGGADAADWATANV